MIMKSKWTKKDVPSAIPGLHEPNPYEPEEDDITTEDHSKFYQSGKLVLTVDSDASEKEMWKKLNAYMKKSHFYPNVWVISDHGNAHLMSPTRWRIHEK